MGFWLVYCRWREPDRNKERFKRWEGLKPIKEPSTSIQKGSGRWKGAASLFNTPESAQIPILITGKQGRYVPWQSQKIEGILLALTKIHEGASRWIRNFKEHTEGRLLAVGDLKAVLARIVGQQVIRELLGKCIVCINWW